jgi:hypothetical protein
MALEGAWLAYDNRTYDFCVRRRCKLGKRKEVDLRRLVQTFIDGTFSAVRRDEHHVSDKGAADAP